MINIDKLISAVKSRQNGQIYLSKENAAKEVIEYVPDTWWELCGLEKPGDKILKLWEPMQDLLPELLSQMVEKLQAIAVYTENGSEPKLLYVFQWKENDFYLMLGGKPVGKEKTFAKGIPAEITKFYQEVHNGWVGLFNHVAGGPVAIENWYKIDAVEYDISAERLSSYEFKLNDFTILFTSGQGEFGIVVNPEDVKYMWFFINDDESEFTDSFWEELDYTLGEELSELME